MDRFLNHLRLFWRSESIIADVHSRHALARTLWPVFAMLAIGLGAVTLSIAAYPTLEQYWGQALAAAALGGFHIVLAVIAMFVATRVNKLHDLNLAREVRDSALAALSDYCRDLQSEIGSLVRILRHPVKGALPALIVPLAGIVLKAIRKHDTSKVPNPHIARAFWPYIPAPGTYGATFIGQPGGCE